MDNYFAQAKQNVIQKLEKLVRFYDDWMEIFATLDIPAPVTYTIHPTRDRPTMNTVLAGTVGYNVICTEFKMALYNLIKLGVYNDNYQAYGFQIVEVELGKQVENTSSMTKKYKPYFLYDAFKFEVPGSYYDFNKICIEEDEDSQFGGWSSGERGDLQTMLAVLKFIKFDLLPKYREVEHVVYSDSYYIYYDANKAAKSRDGLIGKIITKLKKKK
jgi:hypothetical protein